MTIRATATARDYAPDKVRARYVKQWVDGSFHFAEVGDDPRYDIRQGTVDADDLPDDTRTLAEQRRGMWPGGVEWPL